MKFFDVWHGIMFKGFAPEDFRVQHRYDETWVTSRQLKELYVRDFGFDAHKVQVTGYARTDALVQQALTREQARQANGLPEQGNMVLFAPTWQSSKNADSIYPFGVPEEAFLKALSDLGQRTDSTVVVRTHLNTRSAGSPDLPNLLYRPYETFPDAETLLLACDVLVVDWSSIAFDWLLLDRPTVFLDVPMPTPRGFALGPEYRWGDVVTALPAMLAAVEKALMDPAASLALHAERRSEVLQAVYDDRADGKAGRRCMQRLESCIQGSLAMGTDRA